MNAWVVVSVYGLVLLCAVALLYRFRHAAWYWHVLSVAAAAGVAMMPPPSMWQGPVVDVVTGSLFLLLFIWGVGALVFLHPLRH